MTVSQILNAAANLDYVYAEPGPSWPIWWRNWMCFIQKSLVWNLELKNLELFHRGPITKGLDLDDRALSLLRRMRDPSNSKETSISLELVFSDIEADTTPSLTYEVYLAAEQAKSRRDWRLVGVLDFFGAAEATGKAHGRQDRTHSWTRRMEVSGALHDLQEQSEGSKFVMHLVPKGAVNAQGRDVLPKDAPPVLIRRVRLELSNVEERM